MAGRTISIRKAQANFYGGKAVGTFDARLLADPSYEFHGRFDRVDLARLGYALPSLRDGVEGTASAALTLSSHGVGHENLVRILQGGGRVDARNVELPGLDFASLISGDNQGPPSGRFVSAKGNFRIGGGGIEVTYFDLENAQGRFQAEGRIDFSHAINLRIHPSILHAATTLPSAPPSSFVLGGTIESPRVVSPTPPPKTPAKSSHRAR